MRKRRQNLLLFYDTKRFSLLQGEDIGSRLVKSYMNKFCIVEDDQCEIDGIFSIESRPPYLEERDMGYYETTSEFHFRPFKEKLLVSGSSQSITDENTVADIHLIMETTMYMIRNDMCANILNDSIREMILDWMDFVPNVSGYKHVIVTLLQGAKERLCTNAEVKIAYKRSNSEKKKVYKVSSFHDDLEKFHNYLKLDFRKEYPKTFEWLFLFQQLDESKVTKSNKSGSSYGFNNPDRKMLPGPSSYSQLIEYTEHQLEKPWHYKNKHLFVETEVQEEKNYIQYDCARFTFEVPRLLNK